MKSYKSFISEAPTSQQAAKIAPDVDPAKRDAALKRSKDRELQRNADMAAENNARESRVAATNAKPNSSALVRTNQLAKREPSALAKTDKPGALAKIPPVGPPQPKKPKNVMQGEPAGRIRRNVDNGPEYSPPRTTKTKLTSPKPKARKEGGREGGRGGDYADRGYKKKGNLPLGTRTLANYLAGKALKDRRETKAYGSKAEPGEGPRIQGQQT